MAAMLENDVIKNDVTARNLSGLSVGLIVGSLKFISVKFHACITK